MDRLAESLDQAADSLTALAREVPGLDVAPGAFAVPPAASLVGAGDVFRPSVGAVTRRVGTDAGQDAAEGSGLPGRVGRALHDRWVAVLEARAHETSAAAARLTTMAASVRVTQRAYAETDEAVQRRFTREM